jgi:hypothetical protein
MIRIDEESGLGVAIATDGNGRYAKLDPYAGAQLALAEAYRNVATTGAKPLAVSDCLNFGSPEDPAVMWQFAEAVRGLADACQQLEQELTAVERELMNMDAQKPRPGPSRLKEKLAILSSMIDESDHAPTQGARDVYAVLSAELEQHRQRLASILDQRLPEFTELLRSLEIPPIA